LKAKIQKGNIVAKYKSLLFVNFARSLNHTTMSKKLGLYIGFFILLAVGFYFALTAFIPGYGKVSLPKVSYVRPFSYTNQDGAKVTDQDMLGKVYVAEYFFTTCPGICKIMNANMRKVYDQFNGERDFRILSFTCDPETDSALQLRKYADSLKVNTAQWVFLTGRKDSLYNTARISYMIDDPQNNLKDINDDFLHTQNWALVDKKGDVRKIYDGLKEQEINNMMNDARKLLKEK
jgi:protein SCO1/2